MSQPDLVLGTYRHSKTGQLYEVIGTALQTETDELLVIYRPLYESQHSLFARPYEMFIETVQVDGRSLLRFEKLPSKVRRITDDHNN